MAKGGAKKAKATSLTCPACGTAASYPSGPAQCRVCGTWIPRDADAPLDAAPAPAAAQAPSVLLVEDPSREPPLALAIVALVCGILSLATLWVLPVCLLLGVAAIVCGAIALTDHKGDGSVQAMAGIGIGLAVLGMAIMWYVFATYDGGSGDVYVSSSSEPDQGGSGSDGGGSGGSSGEGGGSGGESGSGGAGGSSGGEDAGGGSSGDSANNDGSGGGDTGGGGGGGDVGVDAPAPVAALTGLGLLAFARWRRRA